MIERILDKILEACIWIILIVLAIGLFIGSPILVTMMEDDQGFKPISILRILGAPGYALIGSVKGLLDFEQDVKDNDIRIILLTVVISLVYWFGLIAIFWLAFQQSPQKVIPR